jgi:hypothetical protein
MSKVTLKVEIPQTPNFIRLTPGGVCPVHLFSEKELKAIGREWTKALIQKAKKTNGNRFGGQ